MAIIHIASVLFLIVTGYISDTPVKVDASETAKIIVLVAEAIVRHRNRKKENDDDALKH